MSKNCLLKKKSKCAMCCEVVFPIVIIGVLLGLLIIIQQIKANHDPMPVPPLGLIVNANNTIVYGPSAGMNKQQQDVLKMVMAQVALFHDNKTLAYFIPFETQLEMDQYYANHSDTVKYGLWFQSNASQASPSTPFEYAIRQDSASLPPNNALGEQYSTSFQYTSSGFTSLQVAVDQAILTLLGGFNHQLVIQNQLFPDPNVESWQTWKDGRDMIYKNAGGIFITAALFISVFRLITELVVEKEMKIRESMKMIGMSDVAYYLSWNITTWYICLPVAIIMALILRLISLIYHTNLGLLVVLFLFYMLTLVLLGCILSIFFDKSKFAGIISFIIVIGFSVAAIFIAQAKMSKRIKLILSLISPVAFNNAIYTAAMRDYNGIDPDYSYYTTEAEIIGMLAVDMLFYLLALWYLDKVVPGEFGTTQPLYFFLLPSFWRPSKKSYESIINDHNDSNNMDVEMTPMDIRTKKTVSIRNLKKQFQTGDGVRTAVDGLYLDMYQDQIHAFLGHNGAGKSVTIGMLTGLIPLTGGDAFIQGHSVRNQMPHVRQVIGVCPQHDIIWKELTVLEHLKIYAALKGVPSHDIQKEAERMAKEVGLPEKMNAPSGTLSGGQKRKLCLGIAFIGRSEVIFLDEVTSGMDPLSRRSVWDFLLKYKQGRTIILTTHFMDEADFLGDRIAIISHGKLRCDGSSMFLKKKFGIGYLLTMAKMAGQCNTQQVTKFIHQFIPEAVVLSDAGTELSFRLPTSSVEHFAPFFRELDQQLGALHLSAYGISVTTMEEVFLRIGQESSAKQFDINANENHDASIVNKAISTSSAGRGAWQQFRGLFIKRLHTSYKDLKGFVLSILLPGAIIAASIVVYKTVKDDGSINLVTAPLTFNMSMFGPRNFIPIQTPDNYIETLRKSPEFSRFSLFPTADNFKEYLIRNNTDVAGAFNFTTSLADNFTGPFASNPSDIPVLGYNMLFNTFNFHTIPTYLNTMHDALLRNLTGGTGILATSMPFSHVLDTFQLAVTNVQTNAILYFIILYMCGYSLMAGSFASNVCYERSYNIKRLLYISGCKRHVYWLSNLVWDYTLAFVLLLGTAIALVVAVKEFNDHFGLLFFGLVLYCACIIPLSYLMSYMFRTPGKATGAIFGILFALGLVFILVSINMHIYAFSNNAKKYQDIGDILDHIFFVLSPVFCLGKLTISISKFPGMTRMGEFSFTGDINQWRWYYCGAPLTFLAIHLVVWLSWLFILDYVPMIRGKLRNPKNYAVPTPDPNEDSDVAFERQRVRQLRDDDEVVIMKSLHKLFKAKGKNPNKIAVHNTCLGIPRGQTFGLLGMNGAGKTTTLSMLSGDLTTTAGSATINGFDLVSQRSKALHSIGSCPQFDALIPLLSAREQLRLYSRIKGIPEASIDSTVEAFITMMDLGAIANSNVGGYSGGNKRKISLSIAMIGNPSVVFLDEPSTGCDPQVRRFMWNVISELGANKVIIITTHSMEECEALCQRLSIMKDGKFTCLGSNQHIKSKFGSGYSIDIKFKKEYLDSGVDIVLKAFPGSFLLDRHDLIANFELPNSVHHPVLVSEIFSTLQNHLTYILDDYSVSQTSLEQVFLKLTSSKHEDRMAQYSERHQDLALTQPLFTES
ncbi:hypothetical protein SAMD00019534_055870 [Acytostelium subglobosum LB1]|uniref:hypothetical protein n=1 Tax=Acytostelium subglobosum LB1 TaxID=1410327 RepID=UPI0006449AE5|nr:hypothetical protein SAMD00019534_055870 [Acytostelium subglobosum LB1]GAM22412.1 hypothetical protein SAMD00019534_055870 [Acytostelium subglobosum LB1]|eukprot:XP_012754532.1 hypothetical protein SAMD00019534_055870 [Acytostelium subglobosum LB1]